MGWLGIWDAAVSVIGKELAGILLTAVGLAVMAVLTWLGTTVRNFYLYFQRIKRIEGDARRTTDTPWPREGRGLWIAPPLNEPRLEFDPNLGPPRVLLIANAKGGVGKTTVAANLAARFSELAIRNHAKPVLMLDLDFQGSLSSMSIAGNGDWLPPDDRDSDSSYLISGDWDANDVAGVNKTATWMSGNGSVVDTVTLKLITSFYDLAQAENRVMIEWLLSNREDDIRFRLKKLLHSDAVRAAYSLIIIDCPPRVTTATIQALAAGTHLLVPTKLDTPSSEAVVTFIRQVETFREAGLCPYIQYAGVVGTMVDPVQNLDSERQKLEDRLSASWANGGTDGKARLLPRPTEILDNVVFRNAGGRGIAYFNMGNAVSVQRVKSSIRALASVVAQAVVLPAQWHGQDDEIQRV